MKRRYLFVLILVVCLAVIGAGWTWDEGASTAAQFGW